MLWLVPLFFLWCGVSAQSSTQSFVITHSGSVPSISIYEDALKHNDLDRFRALEHRTLMFFTEGVIVELLSGNEMVQRGLAVDLSKVDRTGNDPLKHSQFVLHPSGRILQLVTPVKKGQ